MKTVFFSAALMASSAAMGALPIDGWYSSLFGGITDLPDNIDVRTLGFARNHANYTAGFHGGGSFGFQCNPLRYEAQFTFLQANINRFDLNTLRQFGVSGRTSAALGMANIYYDFPDMIPTLQPFLGIGLGYGWIDTSLKSLGPFPFGSNWYSGSNGAFAYQGTAGITFNFAENYALNIAYRYVGTGGHVDSLGKVLQAHLGTIGVVYRFNGNVYK